MRYWAPARAAASAAACASVRLFTKVPTSIDRPTNPMRTGKNSAVITISWPRSRLERIPSRQKSVLMFACLLRAHFYGGSHMERTGKDAATHHVYEVAEWSDVLVVVCSGHRDVLPRGAG